MSPDRHLLERIRTQALNRERFEPREDRGELPQVADIRLIRALSSGAQRLALVLRVCTEQNFVVICLLSNEVDMMSDFDVLLTREETGLPFDVVAELDLTVPVYLIQASSLFGRFRSADLLRQLQTASAGDIESVGPGLRGQPIRGQTDPRWEYKEKELAALQELSHECTHSVVEGKTEVRTVIDPALLDEVIAETESNPLEKTLELVAIAEAAQGGVASVDQITRLLDEYEDLFAMDQTLRLAVLPLLEAAISSERPPTSIGSVKIANRSRQVNELETEFRGLLQSVLTAQSGPILRVVTCESAWTGRLGKPTPIPIDIQGHGLVYADARDPRRAE